MSPLLKVLMVALALVFVSTGFYIYHPIGLGVGGDGKPKKDSCPECPIPPAPKVVHVPANPKDKMMCNVAVAVYTTPQHAATRVADAKRSWTRRICTSGTPQFMFIGLPENLNITDSVDVPCGTDYYSLCCKSMNGLALLYKKYPNADWYYKVDDDTILVPHNVEELLGRFDHTDKLMLGYAIDAGIDPATKEFKGQIFVPYTEHHNGQLYADRIRYCSGSGYVMSGALVRGMMENMTRYEEVWKPICDLYDPEDVAVGLFAAKFGARIQHFDGVFNKGWNWEDGPNEGQDFEVVSAHLSRDTSKMVYYDRLMSGAIPKKAKN